MIDFKSGELLIYRDRIQKRNWSVISLYRHKTWAENVVCYCFSAPEGMEEDVNTIMNIPAFFLWRPSELFDPDKPFEQDRESRQWFEKPPPEP